MSKSPSNNPAPAIQPDTIPVPGEAGNQAIELLDKHRNVVLSVTAIAILGICGTLIVRELNRQKRSEAAQAYSVAAGERSIEKLDAVVSDYAGSVAAGNAMLSKADIQLSQEKFEDARATFQKFVDEFKNHPRHAQGLYALGNLSHKNGDFEAANGFYDRALAEAATGDLGPLVLIRKGDIALAEADTLRKAGNDTEADAKLDEARQNYDDAITRTEFRSGPFITIAEQRLELAAVGNVPVVPAPPKPEPEPETKPEETAEPAAKEKPKSSPVPAIKDEAPASPAKEKAKASSGEEKGKNKEKAKPKADSPPKPKPESNGKSSAKADTPPKPKAKAESPKADKKADSAPKATGGEKPEAASKEKAEAGKN